MGEFTTSICRVQESGTMNMEAADSSQTFFLTFHPKWHHITGDCNLSTDVVVVFLLEFFCFHIST